MKLINRLLCVSAACLLVLASCAKMEGESFDKYEQVALKAWMTQHRPELLDNLQTDGGYYIDIVKAGKTSVAPVNDTVCWVRFDFSGRDLSGNIILSRNEDDAKLAGTFTKYTRYVPYFRYCGEQAGSLVEGTHLAMRNKIVLGDQYFNDNKDRLGITSKELLLREGSEVVLYMPSRIVGNGIEGSGGYEGQYTLDARKPLIVTMSIRDTVKNPLASEGSEVDQFCKDGGGLTIFDSIKLKRPTKLDDPAHPYNRAERWVNAADSVPQVYVDFRFDPSKRIQFPAGKTYKSNYAPYNVLSKLESDIEEVLIKRFHKDEAYTGVKELKDSVTLKGTAKIWYIGRFPDGFIFDTNIDEVKKLIYGEVKSTGAALSYTPENGGMIQAFYYTIPNLRYGQWAAMITTSTNGYGAQGKSGSTTTSTSGGSGYNDYNNYYNYYNNYYGNNGYYGGYYDNYYGYGGYGNGMYGGYGYGYDYGTASGNNDTSTTTKTVSTEVPSFSPLIFEIYIEPKAK